MRSPRLISGRWRFAIPWLVAGGLPVARPLAIGWRFGQRPTLLLGGLAAAALHSAAPAAANPAEPATVPQIPRDGWKDCSFNDRLIRCRDQPQAGGLRIIWIDGPRNLYRPEANSQPGAAGIWVDRQGGRWRHEVLVQGNTVLTHLGNGSRIVVPLRFPCRPPLQGEVGYCRP